MSRAVGRVVALSGGIGGAKLALGLYRVLPPDTLTVVANTGDDFEHLGLMVSPDIDTLLYTLAGLDNPETGWGRCGETWTFMAALEALGGETWFKLGDGDLATHVERTRRLRAGESLGAVTDDFRRRLGIRAQIVPMSDDPVRTRLLTQKGWLDFQDWFVRLHCEPAVREIDFAGAATARPHPDLLAALAGDTPRLVVVCPSNPLISIDPILSVPGVREALRACRAPVVAVSPLIAGEAVKGPTAKMMAELGMPVEAAAVARHYRDFLDHYVIDKADADAAGSLEFPLTAAQTLMRSLDDRVALARTVLAFGQGLSVLPQSPMRKNGAPEMLGLVNTPNGTAPVEIRELPEPTPAANEALVEVHAFSLNRGELRLMQVRPEGWRPGQDISGVVLRGAADGSGPKAGTRVVALTDNAGWAERAAVPTHRMAALADNVSFAEAAALPVAGLTALRTLRHGAPLLGKRVLVTGAAGGVGHMAVQIATRSGAEVTAVVGSPERGRHVRGAAAIVDGIDKAEGRFELVLEAAGGASLGAAIARVAARGTVVVFGNSSGEPTPINFRDFAEHPNARIQSFSYFTSEPEERFAPDLALLAALVADGSLKLALVESSWQDIARIGPELRDRRIAGKAVFRVEHA